MAWGVSKLRLMGTRIDPRRRIDDAATRDTARAASKRQFASAPGAGGNPPVPPVPGPAVELLFPTRDQTLDQHFERICTAVRDRGVALTAAAAAATAHAAAVAAQHAQGVVSPAAAAQAAAAAARAALINVGTTEFMVGLHQRIAKTYSMAQRSWMVTSAIALAGDVAAVKRASETAPLAGASPMRRPQTALDAFIRALNVTEPLRADLTNIHADRQILADYHFFVGNTAQIPSPGIDTLHDYLRRMHMVDADEIPPQCCVDLAAKLGEALILRGETVYNHDLLLRVNLWRIFRYSTRERAAWLINRAATIPVISAEFVNVVFDALVGRVDGSPVQEYPENVFLSKTCVDAMMCGCMRGLYTRIGQEHKHPIADEFLCAFFATFTDLTNARYDMVDALAAGGATSEISLQASMLDSTCMNMETGRCQLADLYPLLNISNRIADMLAKANYINANAILPQIRQALLNGLAATGYDPQATHDETHNAAALAAGWQGVVRAALPVITAAYVGQHIPVNAFDECVSHLLRAPGCNTGDVGADLIRYRTNLGWGDSLCETALLNELYRDFKMTAMADRLLANLVRRAHCRPRVWGNGHDMGAHDRVYGLGYYGADRAPVSTFRDDDVVDGIVTVKEFTDSLFPLLQKSMRVAFLGDVMDDGVTPLPALSDATWRKYELTRDAVLTKEALFGAFAGFCLVTDLRWSLPVCAFLTMDGVMPNEAGDHVRRWRLSMSRFILNSFASAKFGEHIFKGVGGATGGTLGLFLGQPALSATALSHRLSASDYGTQFITVLVILMITDTFKSWDVKQKETPANFIHECVVAGCNNLPDAISARIRKAIDSAYLQHGLRIINAFTAAAQQKLSRADPSATANLYFGST